MTALEKEKCQNLADAIADETELSPKLYRAIAATPREIFVPIAAHAYDISAHPIDGGQWISSPLSVAKMTAALECENADNVLEIGCGSGYQAALLANLVRRVFTIERINKLATDAKKRFETLQMRNIHVRFDDGSLGWSKYAPFDRIILSCACAGVPQRLFDQLAYHGILVAPVQVGKTQQIRRYRKGADGKISEEILENCLFVPLLDGTQN